MIEIAGVYEIAVKVADLERSAAFYCDVLGLGVGLRDDSRRWLFLRAGGAAGMVVLQEDRGSWPQQHFAFTVTADALERAAAELQGRGIVVDGPMTHDWIPARSLYFADPDGHDVELLAPGTAP
ncbi:MAG TPA: VOC family protein [Candidatus Limnocylindrales bacterium]|nr:VOC family protein [Candidatus Limnocylindrales bacterium]